jgi:hypothetical protein
MLSTILLYVTDDSRVIKSATIITHRTHTNSTITMLSIPPFKHSCTYVPSNLYYLSLRPYDLALLPFCEQLLENKNLVFTGDPVKQGK